MPEPADKEELRKRIEKLDVFIQTSKQKPEAATPPQDIPVTDFQKDLLRKKIAQLGGQLHKAQQRQTRPVKSSPPVAQRPRETPVVRSPSFRF